MDTTNIASLQENNIFDEAIIDKYIHLTFLDNISNEIFDEAIIDEYIRLTFLEDVSNDTPSLQENNISSEVITNEISNDIKRKVIHVSTRIISPNINKSKRVKFNSEYTTISDHDNSTCDIEFNSICSKIYSAYPHTQNVDTMCDVFEKTDIVDEYEVTCK